MVLQSLQAPQVGFDVLTPPFQSQLQGGVARGEVILCGLEHVRVPVSSIPGATVVTQAPDMMLLGFVFG